MSILETVPDGPKPLYSVYRAADYPIRCFRAVTASPAPPTDFLSHMQLAESIDWWDLHRAAGVSAWLNPQKVAALARRKGLPMIAEIDLSRADGRMPWAQTGHGEHVTIWATPGILLQAVVGYADVG